MEQRCRACNTPLLVEEGFWRNKHRVFEDMCRNCLRQAKRYVYYNSDLLSGDDQAIEDYIDIQLEIEYGRILSVDEEDPWEDY